MHCVQMVVARLVNYVYFKVVLHVFKFHKLSAENFKVHYISHIYIK